MCAPAEMRTPDAMSTPDGRVTGDEMSTPGERNDAKGSLRKTEAMNEKDNDVKGRDIQ